MRIATEKPQLGVRIPPQDEKKIIKLIEDGKFLNVSDFLRTCIREKLEKVEANSA